MIDRSSGADPSLGGIENECEPGVRGAGSRGLLVKAEAMFDNDFGGLNDPATDGEPTCPRCGTRIESIETRGPSDHEAGPCGHQVGSMVVREFVHADEDRLVADGGTATRQACERDDLVRLRATCEDCGNSIIDMSREWVLAAAEAHREECGAVPDDEQATVTVEEVDDAE